MHGLILSRLLGLGSRHQFREPKGDTSAGCDRGRARAALGDPRQWTGADESAFFGVGCGAADRVSAHSTGKTDAERARRKLSRAVAGRMLECELVSKLVRCAAQDRGVENRIQRRTPAQ